MIGAWARRIAVFQRSLHLIATFLRTRVHHWLIADRRRSCGIGPAAAAIDGSSGRLVRLVAPPAHGGKAIDPFAYAVGRSRPFKRSSGEGSGSTSGPTLTGAGGLKKWMASGIGRSVVGELPGSVLPVSRATTATRSSIRNKSRPGWMDRKQNRFSSAGQFSQ